MLFYTVFLVATVLVMVNGDISIEKYELSAKQARVNACYNSFDISCLNICNINCDCINACDMQIVFEAIKKASNDGYFYTTVSLKINDIDQNIHDIGAYNAIYCRLMKLGYIVKKIYMKNHKYDMMEYKISW